MSWLNDTQSRIGDWLEQKIKMANVQFKVGSALKSTALTVAYTMLYVIPRGLIKGAFEMEADNHRYTELQVLIVKTFFVIGCAANLMSMTYSFIMRTNYTANFKVVLSAVVILILLFELFFI